MMSEQLLVKKVLHIVVEYFGEKQISECENEIVRS